MKKGILGILILSFLVWGVSTATAATISGRVTKVGGEPMANILVIAVDETCVGHTIGDARTNANGEYAISVPTGSYYINNWMDDQPSYYPAKYWTGGAGSLKCWEAVAVAVDDSTPAEHIDFQLEYGGIVTGIVYQNDGITEITGVSVDVSIIQGDPCGDHQYVIGNFTNPDDGSFSISGIPPGTYFFRTYTGDSDYIDEWWRIDGNSLNCNDAQTITIVAGATNSGYSFQLEEGGAVSGYVFEADTNQPIANVLVFAQDQACGGQWLGGANTDENGFYRIHAVQSGPVYLRTNAPGNGLNYVDESWDDAIDCNNANEIIITAGTETTERDFYLSPGGIISGFVYGPDGTTPIAEANVNLYTDRCHNGHQYGLQTDENGRYEFIGLPSGAQYILRADTNDSGEYYIPQWYNNLNEYEDCNTATFVGVGESIAFSLILGGAVSGHIYNDTGSPLTNIHVYAYSSACGGAWLGAAPTDSSGSYRIEGVLPGEVYLQTAAASHGYNFVDEFWDDAVDCSAATSVTVNAGTETTERDFYLSPGGTISGHVYEQGTTTPIIGAVVNIYSDICHNGHLFGVQTNENGYFECTGLPLDGQFILRADTHDSGQNYVSQWYNNIGDAEDCSLASFVTVETEDIAFYLVEGASISGHVADESGASIENVHVYATDADTGNWLGGTNTDVSGSFHLAGLPSVDCRVHICPTCNDLPYVDEFYNDTYFHHLASILSLTAGNDVVLNEIRLVTSNTISGTISGLDTGQHVQVNAIDDGGTPDWEDDLYFHKGYVADASNNAVYSLNVLPGHSYRIEVAPEDDPRVFYRVGHPAGTYSWTLASHVDPVANPNTIDVQITHGVQLSGTINGLEDGQRVWVNVHCENGTPEDGSDDFGFGVEIWGSGTGTDLFSLAVPTGYTYRVCFNQDNGLTACYDGTEDGSFGHVDPNVVVDGELTLDPLTVTDAVSIIGTVDNLDPHQHVRILVHSGTDTPDGADDFTREEGFDADAGGVLDYSLFVPADYSYIVEFQPENWPSLFYQSESPNGTDDWTMATQFIADADVYNIDLTLPATGSIAGRVFSDGEPVSGLWVEVWSNACWNGWLNGGYTDENGLYSVDNLPVGDVYVRTCAECDQKNYIDRWYTESGGTEDCNYASPVSVLNGEVTSNINFELPIGPRYLNWWEAAVYHGSLGVGFDLLPGFDPFLESAVIDGPNGFNFVFDLQTDVLEWLNECSYLVSWWYDFSGPISYGDYTLTLKFTNGTTKTYTHELLQVDVTAVNSTSMTHTVNDDGSIDFFWTNPPDPNQRYQVRIYQAGERFYRSGMLDTQNLHVSADSLKCLVLGGEYTWEMRAYDNNDPYYTCEKSNSLPLTYDPISLENRAKWFSATNYLGVGNSYDDKLSLYFDVRPGSRDFITSAAVTGPSGFTPYNVDLTNDWYDISTETRKNSGWGHFLSAPVLDGAYTLTITFNDNFVGYTEVDTYDLSVAQLSAVDAATMNHEIYENGAMRFSWNLPTGVTGQRYNIRIRSADGSQEFVQSATHTDATQMYLSPWDMRALIHGQTFQWFVHTIDSSGGSWIRSDPITFVYDPFQFFSDADTDKDWDVDGSDLAEIVRMIQNGDIGDVARALSEFAPRYGQLQLN